MPPASSTTGTVTALLSQVAQRVRGREQFGEVSVSGHRLAAPAVGSGAPAEYRLELVGDTLWVSLVTADRWLSQSIEQDLVHTGDKLADLIHEELVELGHSGGPVPCEHFRDDEKLFTFRSRVPVRPESFGDAAAADISTLFLRAYEACFRRLGDMEEKPD